MKKNKTKNHKLNNLNINKTMVILICAVVCLCLIGVVFIYSASNYSAKIIYGNSFYFVTKQIFGVVLGFFSGYDSFDYAKDGEPVEIIDENFVPSIGFIISSISCWTVLSTF